MRLALAGDTMLGRGVAEALTESSPQALVSPEVVEIAHEADLFVLNLECCISARGSRWPAIGKPFFFRAPPEATEVLQLLGVDCVTLANNHALDFGIDALLDTFSHLADAGIAWVGAGPDLARARAPVVLDAKGYELAVVGCTDHPVDFAATPDRPGVALADFHQGVPDWLITTIRDVRATGVLVTPHWGPNMIDSPLPYVRRAASCLVETGATLVAGHSAHVVQGVGHRVLYDLGDFLDDYATDPVLRNDLGLLFLVELDAKGPKRLEAVPLALDFCHTRLADGADADWIRRRFRRACAALGVSADEQGGRIVVEWADQAQSAKSSPNGSAS